MKIALAQEASADAAPQPVQKTPVMQIAAAPLQLNLRLYPLPAAQPRRQMK
ncbi:hypothetical protein [Pseudomonas sp. R3-56]|uniref:hypothetical protein n=1 Tax=Pseudomonas sp. R3-56 TaxID=2817401 RepID=UPI003DA903A0